jgi:hypothetical protein
MTWWTVICWPITPFLLKCCPNFHQHHRNSHQPPLVVLCFLPITQPPPTSHSLSLDPVAGQPPESPLPMPSLPRALRPGPCSSPSPVYHTAVPRPVRRRHSSPSPSSRAQSAVPTSPLLPSLAGRSLQVHEQKPGTTDGGRISSPYSQIQGVGTPHLPNPP